MQAAVHVQYMAALPGAQQALAEEFVETGGEDLPDAYSWVPANPEEAPLKSSGYYEQMRDELSQPTLGGASTVAAQHRQQQHEETTQQSLEDTDADVP